MVNERRQEGRTSFAFFRHRHRVAAAGFVFAVGVTLILGAELASAHHVISTALGDAGGLLTGSIALAIVYDIIVKPGQTEETLAVVTSTVWEPMRTLLDVEREQTADLVGQLSAPMNQVLTNQELLFSQRVNLTIPDAVASGFLGVIPRLDFEQMFAGLGAGDELLWLDTYCPVQRSAEDALFHAVQAGAHIKMLAIDPDAPNCTARADEIRDTAFTAAIFRREAIGGLEHLRDYAAASGSLSPPGSLEVRLYRGLPCIPMYLKIRDGKPHVGYTGFFLTKATYREPHVVWGPERPPGFLERFEEYFRHRWELADDASNEPYLLFPGDVSQQADQTPASG